MAETKGSHLPESFVRSQLSAQYIAHEETLLGLSGRTLEPVQADLLRKGLDESFKTIVEGSIFRHIPDQDKRPELEASGLNAAKDFWSKKLKEPGLSINAATLGRERVTEITQRLEDLNKPSQNPK